MMQIDKYRKCQKELHCIFVGLDKMYNRVAKEELSYCMNSMRGVAEKYESGKGHV